MISLGCEVNQPENLLAGDDAGVETLTIQELGGTAATVNAALAHISHLVAQVTESRRVPIPLAELTLGFSAAAVTPIRD